MASSGSKLYWTHCRHRGHQCCPQSRRRRCYLRRSRRGYLQSRKSHYPLDRRRSHQRCRQSRKDRYRRFHQSRSYPQRRKRCYRHCQIINQYVTSLTSTDLPEATPALVTTEATRLATGDTTGTVSITAGRAIRVVAGRTETAATERLATGAVSATTLARGPV